MGARVVDLERVIKLMDIISKSEDEEFQIINFMAKHNIPYEDKGNGILMGCFRHKDTHPSMRVNVSLNQYHCFSCGAKGKFVYFLKDYYSSLGKDLKTSSILEELLKDNIRLQTEAGFKSIYMSKKEDINKIMDNLFMFSKSNTFSEEFNPKSNLQVVNRLKRTGSLSKEDKLKLMYYIQEDLEPKEVYNIVKDNSKDNTLNLSHIMGAE